MIQNAYNVFANGLCLKPLKYTSSAATKHPSCALHMKRVLDRILTAVTVMCKTNKQTNKQTFLQLESTLGQAEMCRTHNH